jgi:zinc transporter ZupT
MVHFSFAAHGFAGGDVQPGTDVSTTLPPAAAETGSSIPPAVWTAFFYGLLSGASFPLGALLGIFFAPVSPYVVALIVAFGAGALLFAVTVELYGEQLKHLEEHNHHHEGVVEVGICLTMAFVGSLVYIALNRYVEKLTEGDEGEKHTASADNLSNLESGSGITSSAVSPAPSRLATPLATPRDNTKEGDGKDADSESSPGKRDSLSKWKKHKSKVMLTAKLHRSILENRRTKFRIEETAAAVSKGSANAKTLAFGMFVGVLADGVPEAILIGFLASSGKLSMMFIISLFVANFPESFASASLLHEHKTFSSLVIIGMWIVPCFLPAVLAGVACYLVPEDVQGLRSVEMVAASIEGLAGGMMLAMIASVMLPEAFNMAKNSENVFNKYIAAEHKHHGADLPGVLCVAGFLAAVGMKVTGGVLTAAPNLSEHGKELHAFLGLF